MSEPSLSASFKTSTGSVIVIVKAHAVAVQPMPGYTLVFTTCRPEPFMVIEGLARVLEELGL